MNDTQMLNWVAEYVTEINSLETSKRGEKVEIISSDGHDTILTTRSGKTTAEAFRKCVRAAMRELPSQPRRSKIANRKS
jgi:hypothetical protein